MNAREVIALCIRRCSEESPDEWHGWAEMVHCYAALRNGSKERDMVAFNTAEAAHRVGLTIRDAARKALAQV